MHGARIRTDEDVHQLGHGGQRGQIGLTGQVGYTLRAHHFDDLIGVRLLAGTSRDHDARPQVAAQGLQPGREDGQRPTLEGDRGSFEGVKTDERSGTLGQEPGCSLPLLLPDLKKHLGRSGLDPQGAHEVQQDVGPVAVHVAMFTAHAHFVGVEEAVGQPRVLAHPNGNAGQESQPGHLGVAPQNQGGIVVTAAQEHGPAQQFG